MKNKKDLELCEVLEKELEMNFRNDSKSFEALIQCDAYNIDVRKR